MKIYFTLNVDKQIYNLYKNEIANKNNINIDIRIISIALF